VYDRDIDRGLFEPVFEPWQSANLETQRPDRGIGVVLAVRACSLKQTQQLRLAGEYQFLARRPEFGHRGKQLVASPRVDALKLRKINAQSALPIRAEPQPVELRRVCRGEGARKSAIRDSAGHERSIHGSLGLDPKRRRALEFHHKLGLKRFEFHPHRRVLAEIQQHQPSSQRRGAKLIPSYGACQSLERLGALAIGKENCDFPDDRRNIA
jgi:hypothetical protein